MDFVASAQSGCFERHHRRFCSLTSLLSTIATRIVDVSRMRQTALGSSSSMRALRTEFALAHGDHCALVKAILFVRLACIRTLASASGSPNASPLRVVQLTCIADPQAHSWRFELVWGTRARK